MRCDRSHRFGPWVGKIPWRRQWQPTSGFLPGKSLWTEEPGGLQSMGSQRVRHNLVIKQWQQCTCTHWYAHTNIHIYTYIYIHIRASLLAQLVKNPAAMRETWVRFLGWKEPLEKGKATHSSIPIKETKSLEPEVEKADIQYPCCKIYTPPSSGWRDINDHRLSQCLWKLCSAS